MSQHRTVSVVIPSWNSPTIAQAVESILGNDQDPAKEIIVVGADEKKLVPRTERVRVIEPGTKLLPSAARNLGATESSGDLILFTDSDCVVDSNWTSSALTAASDDKHVVGGGIRFPEENAWDLGDNIAVFHSLHVSSKSRVVTGYVGSNNLAVDRTVFESVNGFDPDQWVGEDWDFLNRVRAKGITVHFDPSFAVLHRSGRDSKEKVVAHARSYGDGYVKMIRAGKIQGGRLRADRFCRAALFAVPWSAARALVQTMSVFMCHPAMFKYIRAVHAVCTFYYARRREIFRQLAE
jgi:GT2 family glycosyltransferase